MINNINLDKEVQINSSPNVFFREIKVVTTLEGRQIPQNPY